MRTENPATSRQRDPCNKGRLIGQKRPLKPKDVWTIRVRLQLEGRKRDLAMFNLAIDSKLRACDLVRLKIDGVCVDARVRDRATVTQKKTGRPVRFEITERTAALSANGWPSSEAAEADICSRAVRANTHTCRHGNTRASSTGGSSGPVSRARRMARTRFAARRRRRSTGRPGISGPCSRCSAIRSSRVPCYDRSPELGPLPFSASRPGLQSAPEQHPPAFYNCLIVPGIHILKEAVQRKRGLFDNSLALVRKRAVTYSRI